MSKPRPQIFTFLDDLTSALHAVGKDDLAYLIKSHYTRGGNVSTSFIIKHLVDAVDDSEALQSEFQFTYGKGGSEEPPLQVAA